MVPLSRHVVPTSASPPARSRSRDITCSPPRRLQAPGSRESAPATSSGQWNGYRPRSWPRSMTYESGPSSPTCKSRPARSSSSATCGRTRLAAFVLRGGARLLRPAGRPLRELVDAAMAVILVVPMQVLVECRSRAPAFRGLDVNIFDADRLPRGPWSDWRARTPS